MAEQPLAIGAPIFKSSRPKSLVHLILALPKLDVSWKRATASCVYRSATIFELFRSFTQKFFKKCEKLPESPSKHPQAHRL